MGAKILRVFFYVYVCSGQLLILFRPLFTVSVVVFHFSCDFSSCAANIVRRSHTYVNHFQANDPRALTIFVDLTLLQFSTSFTSFRFSAYRHPAHIKNTSTNFRSNLKKWNEENRNGLHACYFSSSPVYHIVALQVFRAGSHACSPPRPCFHRRAHAKHLASLEPLVACTIAHLVKYS